MSNFSRRKRLVDQFLGREIESLTDNQSIVRILRSKGNNLHEVESSEGETYLMSMPTKFRNVAYVKAGDYVLVEAIEEGDKVKAEMVNIILPEQIPDYIKRGFWPDRFKIAPKNDTDDCKRIENSESDSDSDNELFRNTNRPVIEDDDDDSDESDNSDESSDGND